MKETSFSLMRVERAVVHQTSGVSHVSHVFCIFHLVIPWPFPWSYLACVSLFHLASVKDNILTKTQKSRENGCAGLISW